MPAFIPGLEKMNRLGYSDARQAGKERDPALAHQPELRWYMDHYPEWRSLFDGSALEETISVSQDPTTSDDQETYRWPVRYNLIKSYCVLHAGLLWGRGRTGKDSNELFEIAVDPKVPGSKPRVEAAPNLEDILEYFWAYQSHILRPQGIIQQWSGGCVVKVTWNPWSTSSVLGIQLETIQPEHFFPIWDPLNFEHLIAVKVKFPVSKAVALTKYGLTEAELRDFGDDDSISVEEYWDHRYRWVVLGKKNPDDKGIVARRPSDGEVLSGSNPWKHPITGRGVIPFVYVPRLRMGGFLGDSLAYNLEGLQAELNKTMADFGDALTGGSHPSFGLSDFTGPGKKNNVITIPRHGALNLGNSRPGGNAPKVHDFPSPQVPPQTSEFADRLLGLSENVAGLTPAARGATQGSNKSGVVVALEMLPTTNIVDWARSHWSHAISGRGGINEIASVIWWRKSVASFAARITEPMFGLRQQLTFKPVVPRDRIEVIDEVVRLATARAVSPKEWLRRLGDIEDVDEELGNLIAFLSWMASVEAAVAGRAIEVSESENPQEPAQALPEISVTEQPQLSAPAKEPEGLSQGAQS